MINMHIVDLGLSPFSLFIKQIFLLGYQLSGSYGFAILILSFAVSLLLLPVFIYIEKAKKKDDIIKLKMKPFVDEIKRCYKGQERYYYLKTLNRQFNYSPLRALIPILSLLLQIPFFIAAYQFLEGFEPLSGVSFLFIKDLAQPDGLLGPVNILPILMTVVNLITAYFYTRNGDGSERKQMLIVAGVFLVLLFNLPSGLVLYWTMNNVFSFLRLFITNPEVFKKSAKIISHKQSTIGLYYQEYRGCLLKNKSLLIIIILVSIVGQLNWAWNNNFNDIVVRILGASVGSLILYLLIVGIIFTFNKLRSRLLDLEVKPTIYFALLFSTVYFFVAGKFYFEQPNTALSLISFVGLVPLQLIGLFYLLKSVGRINWFLTYFAFFLLVGLLFFQLIHLYVILTEEPFVMELLNVKVNLNDSYLSNFIQIGLVFVFITLPFYLATTKITLANKINLNAKTYLLSAFYLVGFVFLWDPLMVFSSFPESFNFTGVDILLNNVLLWGITLVSTIVLFFLCPQKYRWIPSVAIVALTIISFIHNTVNPIDVGVINETKFENQQNLALSNLYYLIEGVAGILIIYASFLLLKKHKRYVVVGLVILNVALISEALYSVIQSGKFLRNKDSILNIQNAISFSKTEKNVVFILPDAVQGWAMDRMLKDNPDLGNQLSGFVWYPNTLAVSRVTNTSMAGLLGGHEYAPDLLHADKTKTNSEKISTAQRQIMKKARDEGYTYTGNYIPYVNVPENDYDTWLPKWHKDWDLFYKELGIGVAYESGYTFLWNNALFYSLPYALKAKVYNEGVWFNKKKSQAKNITTEYMKHHFFRLLPFISDTKADRGNFVLLYSLATHHPWHVVNADGTVTRDVSPYENNEWLILTLTKWIAWMKENEVYDNTKIIIASDHGPHWKQFKDKPDISIPFEDYGEETVPLKYLLNFNPILLVKDFNSEGDLVEDMRFLSNMDVPDILFDENSPTKGEPIKGRELPAFVSWWSRDMGDRYEFSLDRKYMVKDSIFDANNWTVVKKY